MIGYFKRKLLIGALKSDYAKRAYDFLPTWIISYILRVVVDFLLYYRLKLPLENTPLYVYYPVNMCIAVLTSICVTMCSPFFYDVVWQYETYIKEFTNHVADHMTWDYYYKWQQRIAAVIAIALVVIFSFVSISPAWLVECIVHTVICGIILGKYEEWRIVIAKPAPVFYEVYDARIRVYQIKYVRIIPKIVKRCYADTELIVDYKAPLKARVVHMKDRKRKTIVTKLQFTFIDDYKRKF